MPFLPVGSFKLDQRLVVARSDLSEIKPLVTELDPSGVMLNYYRD
jgi:hypothetical protein